MKKLAIYAIVLGSLLAITGFFSVSMMKQDTDVVFTSAVAANRPPRIRPEYSDTVIPPNIAPLNFLVDEPGTDYRVRIRSAQKGETIDVASRNGRITIPLPQWQRLLSGNRDQELYFDICVHRPDGQWTRYEPIVNRIADSDIDRYLFYRLIKPIYIVRVNVAIYQRDLQNFEESVVVSNQSFGSGGGCINCHTFAPNHPDQMILHSRASEPKIHQNGMIVVREGKVIKVDTRTLVRSAESNRGRMKKSLAGYTAWHPNGCMAAFAASDIFQFFHAVGENRDVFDCESDLGLYHADSNTVTTTPNISKPDRVETFPTWSPDGRYLYFCSTAPLPLERYKEVRYDLMRIRCDVDSDLWGDVEPVLLAEDTGLSISEPRISPDGRWLLFCMSSYGEFPVFRPSSDLYLMDLKTRQYSRLSVNSPRSESWHCWSRNSRWIAFASKRRDGVFARVYFSYIDEKGHAHKPVLLPQEDPTFYDRFIKTYNAPELAVAPAPATPQSLAEAICKRDFFVGTDSPDRDD